MNNRSALIKGRYIWNNKFYMKQSFTFFLVVEYEDALFIKQFLFCVKSILCLPVFLLQFKQYCTHTDTMTNK